LPTDWAYLAAAWLLWCLLHSLLIAGPLARGLQALLGRGSRLAYNLFALLTLIPVLLLEHRVAGEPLWSWPLWLMPLRLLMLAAALWLLYGGCRAFSLREFSGWSALVRSEPPASTDAPLITDGILSRLRHPWYAAALLLLWVRSQTPATLVSSLVLSAYLVVGAFLEERRLLVRYGAEYARYRDRVPMFIPRLRRLP